LHHLTKSSFPHPYIWRHYLKYTIS